MSCKKDTHPDDVEFNRFDGNFEIVGVYNFEVNQGIGLPKQTVSRIATVNLINGKQQSKGFNVQIGFEDYHRGIEFQAVYLNDMEQVFGLSDGILSELPPQFSTVTTHDELFLVVPDVVWGSSDITGVYTAPLIDMANQLVPIHQTTFQALTESGGFAVKVADVAEGTVDFVIQTAIDPTGTLPIERITYVTDNSVLYNFNLSFPYTYQTLDKTTINSMQLPHAHWKLSSHDSKIFLADMETGNLYFTNINLDGSFTSLSYLGYFGLPYDDLEKCDLLGGFDSYFITRSNSLSSVTNIYAGWLSHSSNCFFENYNFGPSKIPLPTLDYYRNNSYVDLSGFKLVDLGTHNLVPLNPSPF